MFDEKEEDYVANIKKEIDYKVEEVLEDLKDFADKYDIQYEYVLESFRDKMVYKIRNLI